MDQPLDQSSNFGREGGDKYESIICAKTLWWKYLVRTINFIYSKITRMVNIAFGKLTNMK